MQIPKPFTYKDKKYLKWIKGQPCEICGKPGEPHHIRLLALGSGVGKKPHDYATIPLCRECHQSCHNGDFMKYKEIGLDIYLAVINYLMKYIHDNK